MRLIDNIFVGLMVILSSAYVLADETSTIKLDRDDAAGILKVMIDGREALAYQYGDQVDIPHLFPVHTPSGKSLTIEQPADHPHHRSVWFADTVQLPGKRAASFYSAIYSRIDKKDPKSPLNDRIRQISLTTRELTANQVVLESKRIWEADQGKIPMADEATTMRIVGLGHGEYFLDLTYRLTASYDDLAFTSDDVHYAWPYVRVTPEFSVQKGGTIVDSEGRKNGNAIHNQRPHWVDYTNTLDGTTEGVAILLPLKPDQPAPRWLVRDYGCFGPRRCDEQSGMPFTLKKGDTIEQRVGILVHSGNTADAKIQNRYQQYIEGNL